MREGDKGFIYAQWKILARLHSARAAASRIFREWTHSLLSFYWTRSPILGGLRHAPCTEKHPEITKLQHSLDYSSSYGHWNSIVVECADFAAWAVLRKPAGVGDYIVMRTAARRRMCVTTDLS